MYGVLSHVTTTIIKTKTSRRCKGEISVFVKKNEDPAIPLFGIYPKDVYSYHKDICLTVFIATLFVIARTWKQPRSPSTKEWIKKM